MVSQIAHPDYYEAFDLDYAEEQRVKEIIAREAAHEEFAEWLNDAQALIDSTKALLARVDAAREETEAKLAEADYWNRQWAAESYGDWIAQRAEAEATELEPVGYLEPTDEQLCRVR